MGGYRLLGKYVWLQTGREEQGFGRPSKGCYSADLEGGEGVGNGHQGGRKLRGGSNQGEELGYGGDDGDMGGGPSHMVSSLPQALSALLASTRTVQ